MGETPRTDAEEASFDQEVWTSTGRVKVVKSSYARQLERDLSEEKAKQRDWWCKGCSQRYSGPSDDGCSRASCPECGTWMTNYWEQENAKLRAALSATPSRINGVSLVKMFKDQRDEAADMLRRIMEKLRSESGSEDPMEPFAYDASWEALAKEADATLAKCPSYERQVDNLCAGLGITREELRAALDSTTTKEKS